MYGFIGVHHLSSVDMITQDWKLWFARKMTVWQQTISLLRGGKYLEGMQLKLDVADVPFSTREKRTLNSKFLSVNCRPQLCNDVATYLLSAHGEQSQGSMWQMPSTELPCALLKAGVLFFRNDPPPKFRVSMGFPGFPRVSMGFSRLSMGFPRVSMGFQPWFPRFFGSWRQPPRSTVSYNMTIGSCIGAAAWLRAIHLVLEAANAGHEVTKHGGCWNHRKL